MRDFWSRLIFPRSEGISVRSAMRSQAGEGSASALGSLDSISVRDMGSRVGGKENTGEEDEHPLSHVELVRPPTVAHSTARQHAGLGVPAASVSGGPFEHGRLHAEARAGRADQVHTSRPDAILLRMLQDQRPDAVEIARGFGQSVN